jgi:hypothetical protein
MTACIPLQEEHGPLKDASAARVRVSGQTLALDDWSADGAWLVSHDTGDRGQA